MNYLLAKTASGGYFLPSGSGRVAYSDPALDQEYQGMLNLDYVVNSKNTIAFRGDCFGEPANSAARREFFPRAPGLSAQYSVSV